MSEHETGFRGYGRSEVTVADELISVDAYLEHVLEGIPDPDPIELRIGDTLGLVLAEDVASEHAVPGFANSAMDGYAVVGADLVDVSEQTPVALRVTGEAAAGASELPEVERGTAARIMTGAPVPPGADTVVPVELTTPGDGTVRIHHGVAAGAYVRGIGEDVHPGDRLLRAGHRVGPADIGLLAAVGAPIVRCYPPPRVVIVSTGDELVRAERPPGPGQIRDANGPMLSALVRQAGGVPYTAGIVPDDRKAMMYAFDSNLGHADLVIATGGVSAGAYDHVRDVIGALGTVESFKVAMKPGKPQVFGEINRVPVFGLPGNPVSTFVSFEVFVRPALRRLQGRTDAVRPLLSATLTEPLAGASHRRTFARVRLDRDGNRWMATPLPVQHSHVLSSVVRADGLAEIPEDVEQLQDGDPVAVRLLVDP